MTKENLLAIVNEMIDSATDEQKDIIQYMRKHGLTEYPSIVNAGVQMETIRRALIELIEADEAKSNGKSKSLSAVKKYAKQCMKDMEKKPVFKYSCKVSDGNFITTDGYSMLITSTDAGLNTRVMDNMEIDTFERLWNNQKLAPYPNTLELPEVSKITTYMKKRKAENKNWEKSREPFKINGICMSFKYIVYAMQITGSNVLHYKDCRHVLKLEGNGNTFLFMPVEPKEGDTDTEL